MCAAADREEIEIIWVFERLFGEIGLRRRQGALKVGDGFALALVQLRFNVVREDRAGPAMFDGLVRIPEADERGSPAWSRAGDYVPTAIPKWALAEPMWPILQQAVGELRFWILSRPVRVFAALPARPDKSSLDWRQTERCQAGAEQAPLDSDARHWRQQSEFQTISRLAVLSKIRLAVVQRHTALSRKLHEFLNSGTRQFCGPPQRNAAFAEKLQREQFIGAVRSGVAFQPRKDQNLLRYFNGHHCHLPTISQVRGAAKILPGFDASTLRPKCPNHRRLFSVLPLGRVPSFSLLLPLEMRLQFAGCFFGRSRAQWRP